MPSAADQFRAKSPDELRQELTGLRREHFNLRVQKAVQQLNKPSELRRVRREIARALTVLREKEMSEFAQTGKALEFTHTAPEPKLESSEAEVSPEIAAAAAASAPTPPDGGKVSGSVVVKVPPVKGKSGQKAVESKPDSDSESDSKPDSNSDSESGQKADSAGVDSAGVDKSEESAAVEVESADKPESKSEQERA